MNPFLLLKLEERIPSRLIAFIFMLAFASRLPFSRKIHFSIPVIAILWLQITTLVFLELYHRNSESGTNYMFTAATLVVVLLAYLVIENDLDILKSFVHAYVLLMVIMVVLAASSTVLAYVGMVEPHPIYDRGTSQLGGSTVYSIGLTLSNEILQLGDGYLVRPGGLFDESGMFGIYVTLAILANAVVLDNKRYELLLIALGLFTTSLGFYLSVFWFLFFWRRRIWFALCSIFLVAGAVGAFSVQQAQDSLLIVRTLGRVLELFGTNFGGNRLASSMEGAAMLWNAGPWGLNERDLMQIGDIPATFFGPFMTYGSIGGVILYMHIFLFGAYGIIQERGHMKRLFSNNSFRVFIVMGTSLYHRPFCLFFLYYLILLAIYIKEHCEHARTPIKNDSMAISSAGY